MHVLVVYCHPVPESFCAAIRDAVAALLQKKGHDVRVIDLYAEGFDPVMPADERRGYNAMQVTDNPFPAHVAHLKWAEAIVFIYPTWWYGLPAMLKGWLDRVWTPDVAFGMPQGGKRIQPLMTQITRLVVVTTCGAPGWWSHVVGHPGRKTLTRGMRALFARGCRTLFLAHYLMDASTDRSRARFLAAVETRLSRFIP